MTGKHHILAVATIFFVASAIGIISEGLLIVLGERVNIVTMASSVLYMIAAYYLLEGSKIAKYFLTIMSAISFLIGVIAGAALIGSGRALSGTLFLILGIVMVYCLFVLLFSKVLNSEFNRRAAAYQSKRETTAQRYLQELEQENSHD